MGAMDFIFISGNQAKIDYLTKALGRPVAHQKIDLDELQSINPVVIIEHKAKQAYEIIGKPVLVDDASLSLHGMGGLPGPLIKWFVETIGIPGIAELAGRLSTQKANASVLYGLYDGQELHIFEGQTSGSIAAEPRGTNGFGFNSIFIPDGSTKTYAEMDDTEQARFYHREKAVEKLRVFLKVH
jgi:non-canonical purine NTP pyrophosphatase (RdgB/HAM1 family)